MRVLLTRRAFVARMGAALGALALPGFARARVQSRRSIYKLLARGRTCQACYLHDRSKLFPTAKAAKGNRAHHGCNCAVIKGLIDMRGWRLLFVANGPTYVVDRRDDYVKSVLQQYPVNIL
jgi:hypothetical protein